MNCYQIRLKYSMLKAAQENLGLWKLLSVKNLLYFYNSFSVASYSTSIFIVWVWKPRFFTLAGKF